jgi:hypothetical protein
MVPCNEIKLGEKLPKSYLIFGVAPVTQGKKNLLVIRFALWLSRPGSCRIMS